MTLLLEPYDFQAVLFFDPYELCGVEWLTSSVGMDFPKVECCDEGVKCIFQEELRRCVDL